MALRSCPDCGRKVSTMALSCPECGRPFSLDAKGAVQTIQKTSKRFKISKFGGTIFLFLGILGFLSGDKTIQIYVAPVLILLAFIYLFYSSVGKWWHND